MQHLFTYVDVVYSFILQSKEFRQKVLFFCFFSTQKLVSPQQIASTQGVPQQHDWVNSNWIK